MGLTRAQPDQNEQFVRVLAEQGGDNWAHHPQVPRHRLVLGQDQIYYLQILAHSELLMSFIVPPEQQKFISECLLTIDLI